MDYQNLMPLAAHAKRLSELSSHNTIEYIDDVCGDAAVQKVKELGEGELCFMPNSAISLRK